MDFDQFYAKTPATIDEIKWRVSRALERQPASDVSPAALIARLDDELRATVHAVNRLTPTIVEVVVRAPMAARAFEPGQFYRLQNYETLAARRDGTRLVMEGLALTGAWVDRAQGLVSTIVLEMAMTPPKNRPCPKGQPSTAPNPTPAPMVSNTWTDVPISATLRTRARSARVNSIPSANIKKMTPTSARLAICARSPVKPGVNGPMTTPASR